MHPIKKTGAIGGAILLAACWPLAVGQIAQNVLRDAISSLDSSEISAEVVSYDRGYLSAVAQTRYRIEDPLLKEQLAQDGLPVEFVLEHNISHGLLKVNSESRFVDFENMPAVLTTKTQLNGNTEFDLRIKSVDYLLPQSEASSVYLAESSISGKATVLGEVDLAFKFPSVQLQFSSGESISISSVTGHANGKKVNGFWHGQQQINVDESAIISADGTVISSAEAFSYRFSSSTTENGERLDTNHKVKAGKLLSSDGELTDLNLDFTLGQLDLSSFEGLVSIYQDNPVVDEAVLAKSAPLVDRLFNRGFRLSLNELDLVMGEGVFQSTWLLEVPEGTENITQDFSKVIPVMTGQLDTFISNELVDNYPYIQEGIDELVIMEIMQPTNEGYRVDAELEEGNLVFASGQKIPLIALLMSLMMRQ